jgi:hypothetical protein
MAPFKKGGAASAEPLLHGVMLALKRAIMLQQMQFRSFPARVGTVYPSAPAVHYSDEHLVCAELAGASRAP